MNALILTSSTDFTMRILITLKKNNVKCHVMSSRNLPGIKLSRYCKKFILCEPSEFENPTDKIVTKINDYCEKENIDIILTADLDGIFLLSMIKNKLSPSIRLFPTAEIEQLKTLNNKWSFAQLLDKHGIPQPKTMLLEKMDDLKTLSLEFPLIVKPLALGDSIGVKELNSMEELYQHTSQEEAYNKPPLLIQEFIPGKDVDLNILADNGKVAAWSIQEWITDDSIRFIENENIVEAGKNIISALQYNGIGHFDMRIDERDGSVKVIECNPRFWGTLRASTWNGTNFVHTGILLAQGEKIPPQENKKITYMLPARLLNKLLKGKFSVIKNIPYGTKCDLWSIVTDPLTFVYMLFKRLRRR